MAVTARLRRSRRAQARLHWQLWAPAVGKWPFASRRCSCSREDCDDIPHRTSIVDMPVLDTTEAHPSKKGLIASFLSTTRPSCPRARAPTSAAVREPRVGLPWDAVPRQRAHELNWPTGGAGGRGGMRGGYLAVNRGSPAPSLPTCNVAPPPPTGSQWPSYTPNPRAQSHRAIRSHVAIIKSSEGECADMQPWRGSARKWEGQRANRERVPDGRRQSNASITSCQAPGALSLSLSLALSPLPQ